MHWLGLARQDGILPELSEREHDDKAPGRGITLSAASSLLNRVVRGVERRARGRRLPSARDHSQELHRLLDVPWPCAESEEFKALWPEVLARLAEQGLETGRGAYGGWDDADPALASAVWCLTRHLLPNVIVETGVARGLTSRFALEALERNGRGRLLSVDLAPSDSAAPGLAAQTGAAVPIELRGRWMLLRGTSRRCLPSLVEGLEALGLAVDLFIHDSLHSGRNVRFELGCVWSALRVGGAAVVDDVEQNAAFGSFARAHPEAGSVVGDAADGRSQFGCLVRLSPQPSRA
jgi:hypothetical protein